MNKRIIIPFIFLYFLVCNSTAYGQTSNDSVMNGKMAMELKNDTLYSGTGLKFFIGQKLLVGKAAGNDGYFRAVISKKAAIVPSIWGPDKRYESPIENHVNKKKSREAVKKYLLTGDLVTIKKMFLSKTAKPYFYMLVVSTATEDFYCDVRFAFSLGELQMQP